MSFLRKINFKYVAGPFALGALYSYFSMPDNNPPLTHIFNSCIVGAAATFGFHANALMCAFMQGTIIEKNTKTPASAKEVSLPLMLMFGMMGMNQMTSKTIEYIAPSEKEINQQEKCSPPVNDNKKIPGATPEEKNGHYILTVR